MSANEAAAVEAAAARGAWAAVGAGARAGAAVGAAAGAGAGPRRPYQTAARKAATAAAAEGACVTCGVDNDDGVLCDGCDAVFHIHCLGIAQVPEGDWFCQMCADAGVTAGRCRLKELETRVTCAHGGQGRSLVPSHKRYCVSLCCAWFQGLKLVHVIMLSIVAFKL